MSSVLRLPSSVYHDLRTHLLPRSSKNEQAAFVYARAHVNDQGDTVFQYVDWHVLTEDDFVVHRPDHLELRDETRARVIKQAHDLGVSLVEFHSHPSNFPAEFSFSDMAGFDDFVPHVWWRLKGKPYAAVVVAPSGFDALSWLTSPHEPTSLQAIQLESRDLRATGLTLKRKQFDGGMSDVQI